MATINNPTEINNNTPNAGSEIEARIETLYQNDLSLNADIITNKGQGTYSYTGNSTNTITDQRFVYDITQSASSSRFNLVNITGVPNADGSICFVKYSMTAVGIGSVTQLTIHGTEIESSSAEGNKSGIVQLLRISGIWKIFTLE